MKKAAEFILSVTAAAMYGLIAFAVYLTNANQDIVSRLEVLAAEDNLVIATPDSHDPTILPSFPADVATPHVLEDIQQKADMPSLPDYVSIINDEQVDQRILNLQKNVPLDCQLSMAEMQTISYYDYALKTEACKMGMQN